MSWGGWSELKSFGDYCKINSYVDESKKGNGKWRITLEKRTGLLSMSSGLDPLKESVLNNYKYNIKDIPQGVYFIRIIGANKLHPSKFFDYIGRASVNANKTANIAQRGIFGRLVDHYRKIIGLPSRGKLDKYMISRYQGLSKKERLLKLAEQEFNDYEELRQFLKQCSNVIYEKDTTKKFLNVTNLFKDELNNLDSIKNFFNQKVFLSFNIYAGEDNISQISKGEGLALQEYKNRFKDYPYLNEQNEVLAIKTFDKIFSST